MRGLLGSGGTGMDLIRTTNKLRMGHTTQEYFIIPETFLFWGCPIVPAHGFSHVRLELESLRQELQVLT